MFLQKKSIIHIFADNILIRIPILKIVCEWYLPWQENRPNNLFCLCKNKFTKNIDQAASQ